MSDHDAEVGGSAINEVGEMDSRNRNMDPVAQWGSGPDIRHRQDGTARCSSPESERISGLLAKHGIVGNQERRVAIAEKVAATGHSRLIDDRMIELLLHRARGWTAPIVYVMRVLEDPQWPAFVANIRKQMASRCRHRWNGNTCKTCGDSCAHVFESVADVSYCAKCGSPFGAIYR